MNDTDLITTTEAAVHLGRSMSTINQLIKRGDLVGRRIGPNTRGGQWLVSAASVAMLAARWAASPPRRGRPAIAAPSESTQAKRRSRAKQTAEEVSE